MSSALGTEGAQLAGKPRDRKTREKEGGLRDPEALGLGGEHVGGR